MRRLLARVRDMAECRHVGPELQAYLDGAVDDATRERVARHIEACRRCGREAQVYTQIKAALARQGGATDPEAVQRLQAFAAQLAGHGDHPAR